MKKPKNLSKDGCSFQFQVDSIERIIQSNQILQSKTAPEGKADFGSTIDDWKNTGTLKIIQHTLVRFTRPKLSQESRLEYGSIQWNMAVYVGVLEYLGSHETMVSGDFSTDLIVPYSRTPSYDWQFLL